MLSRLLVIALASLLITGIAPARAGAAPASPGARTVASEWKETLEGRRGRAVPGGRLSDSHGVRPSRLVTYTSPVHKAAHGFNALGPHWKAAVPPARAWKCPCAPASTASRGSRGAS